ncbi:hypothetical protein INT43_008051 [Umbelopsis isabellina]|uniref:Chromatin structure-remodeling complex protein RSC7 n=1 Tax=Mortierella isabellina TaxID=91625 RepID=A0A8H7PD22_MORIS|nr:hypothetical protein INT43_008051 [Umbelopsis isabellina]
MSETPAGQMNAPLKRKVRPTKRASYDSDGSERDEDDMTDLSFHSDVGDQFSEDDSHSTSAVSAGGSSARKRGRPPGSRPVKRSRPERPVVVEEKKEEKREESIAEKVVKAVLGGDGEIDELGESRVDRDGHLLGGREYKIPAFSMPSRGDELLMLGKDVVALLNMRDSFVLVNKNPLVVKVDATQTDKNYLIEHGYLRSTFRTRDITIVSARSIFKTFGHRVVKRGRRGRDDYFATGVPEEDSEAEEEREEFEQQKQQPRVASRYYTKTTEIPADTGFGTGAAALSFRRSNLTNRSVINRGPADEVNWIHLAALSVRDFNAQLKKYRNDNPTFYDIHTHIYQAPASKQPRFAIPPTQEALELAAQQDAAAEQAQKTGDTKLAADVPQQQAPPPPPPLSQAQLNSQAAQMPYGLQGFSDQQQFAMNSNQLPYAMQQARLNPAAAKMMTPGSQAAYLASMGGNNSAQFPGQMSAATLAARQQQMALQGQGMANNMANAGIQLPGQRLPNVYGATASPIPQQNASRFGIK